ncbi:MAG: hypothetical protein FWH57_05675 [Oscillospiraceae bacterium]|nr:hypothetical protein [Oscillospiraceae bacterium]
MLRIHVDNRSGGIAQRLITFARNINQISGKRAIITVTLATNCLPSQAEISVALVVPRISLEED